MAYSFLLTGGTEAQTQIARVRDEIDDVTSADPPIEGTDYFLSDERIARRLADVESEASTAVNRALLASASALRTLATNQAYVLKKKSTMGEDIDGTAVASSIMAHAKALENRVATSESAIASAAAEVSEIQPSQAVRVRRTW